MGDRLSTDKECASKTSSSSSSSSSATPRDRENADKGATAGKRVTMEGGVEVIKEESDDSMDSSPEGDAEQSRPQPTTEGPDPPKRKGGRRPIYATSEERKQRNRQAQAAFRERRSEYIKQLEEAIQHHEQNIQSLQAAHRSAADECLMLRYKNSLLERILLEKGIDVQAELYAKTGSPNLGPTHVPQNMVPAPPMQRAILNRHHQSRRSTSSLSSSNLAPKPDAVGLTPLPPPIRPKHAVVSPKARSKPTSHANSPTDPTATGYGNAMSPAGSDDLSVRTSVPPMPVKHQLSPVPMSITTALVTSRPPLMSPVTSAPVSTASYYPTPAFQNHINQLEQEYETGTDLLDAQADMLEDSDMESPKAPAPYASHFSMAHQGQPMDMSPMGAPGPGSGPVPGRPNHAGLAAHGGPGGHGGHGGGHPSPYPSMTQLLESNQEWDPLGLNMMSMTSFPSNFAFDQSNMR